MKTAEARRVEKSSLPSLLALIGMFMLVAAPSSSASSQSQLLPISVLSIVDTQTGARVTEAPQVNGDVFVAQPDGEGGFILGGDFTCIGPTAQVNWGVSCNPPNNRASGLARVRADGSVDPGLLPKLTNSRDQPLGPSIYDLSVDGTTIRLAGDFTSVNGARRTGLAAISTGGKLESWAPRLRGKYVSIALAIETADDGSILVGGSFDRVNGRKQRHLAKFTSNGNLADFRSPIRDSLFIADIAAFGKRVYVGGDALVVSQGRRIARPSAIALGPTGRLLNWGPFQTGKDAPSITSIEPYDGELVFGGDFRKAAGEPRRGLAAFDLSGRLTDWAPRLGGKGAEARYLSVIGGSIFVAGTFTQVSNSKRTGVAAIAADGQATGWSAEIPTNDPYVDIVTASPERTLLVLTELRAPPQDELKQNDFHRSGGQRQDREDREIDVPVRGYRGD